MRYKRYKYDDDVIVLLIYISWSILPFIILLFRYNNIFSFKCQQNIVEKFKKFESDLTIVRDKDDIKRRLFTCYSELKANRLYMFYTSIILDGIEEIKATIPRATYYRYIKDLKAVNIDLSQTYKVTVERDTVDFNPFEWQEVI